MDSEPGFLEHCFIETFKIALSEGDQKALEHIQYRRRGSTFMCLDSVRPLREWGSRDHRWRSERMVLSRGV